MMSAGAALIVVWLVGFILTLPSIERTVGYLHRIPETKDWERAMASFAVVLFGVVWPITAATLYVFEHWLFKGDWPTKDAA